MNDTTQTVAPVNQNPSVSAVIAASASNSTVADVLRANAIRALTMDAVEAAKSGHPGMPMGMAEIAVALWSRHLRHNPANPLWPNRDRFVISNGHGSMLLYALLHLTGYALPLEELKRFRQLHSKTPGHPEVGVTPGVETTTGPLGQGLANAVGMALAERLLATEFNRHGHAIVDHRTYVFLGDGCLMEGISHEACSLAGTLRLQKLIALYDDNGISIDGEVGGWFTDDTPKRFEAYGWNVIKDIDGHDADAVDRAIKSAHGANRPTLICCKTLIGKGAPGKGGTAECHGNALGEKEIALTRLALEWPHVPFAIPAAVYADWDARECGGLLESDWNARLADYEASYPVCAREYMRRVRRESPADWKEVSTAFIGSQAAKAENVATRRASQQAIEAFASVRPEMIGGSADLTGSVFTNWSRSVPITADVAGNYINFGVREFAMCAIANGLALHGGFLPYVGTFLTFSDYARNALRMASLMKLRAVFVFTHDSIGLGEDGPTHQAVEHAASLRLIPGMTVWRPCDTVETAIAWAVALEQAEGPTCLLLTRQNVPFQPRTDAQIAAVRRGGYVLADWPEAVPGQRVVILATGSEVALAMGARTKLKDEGITLRVVSMPSTTLFDRQDAAYRASVLPAGVPRVAIEAGSTDGWRKYVGAADDPHAAVIGIDTFGESAPASALFKHFGFTVEHVANAARAVLGRAPFEPPGGTLAQ